MILLLACATPTPALPYAGCTYRYDRTYDDPETAPATGLNELDEAEVYVFSRYDADWSMVTTIAYDDRCTELVYGELTFDDAVSGVSWATECNPAGDAVVDHVTSWDGTDEYLLFSTSMQTYAHVLGSDGYPAETTYSVDGVVTERWERTWAEDGYEASWKRDIDLDGAWDEQRTYERVYDDLGHLIEQHRQDGERRYDEWTEYGPDANWLSSRVESTWDTPYTVTTTWTYGDDPVFPEEMRVERDDGGSYFDKLSWSCPGD